MPARALLVLCLLLLSLPALAQRPDAPALPGFGGLCDGGPLPCTRIDPIALHARADVVVAPGTDRRDARLLRPATASWSAPARRRCRAAHASDTIEAGEWRLPDVKRLLQDKLYAYATYASDGQMRREHNVPPNARITILVRPVDPIPPDIASFIDQIAAILAQDGLTISVEPLPAQQPRKSCAPAPVHGRARRPHGRAAR